MFVSYSHKQVTAVRPICELGLKDIAILSSAENDSFTLSVPVVKASENVVVVTWNCGDEVVAVFM